uniref:Uncharacterized protein n=1 Tax=Oryza nivara TaxID=4536 RepID=A0A0E0IAJ2_ORYNI
MLNGFSEVEEFEGSNMSEVFEGNIVLSGDYISWNLASPVPLSASRHKRLWISNPPRRSRGWSGRQTIYGCA